MNEWFQSINENLENTGIYEELYAYIPQKERDAMPESDFGDLKNRKYPVKDKAHFEAALKLVGRAPAADRQKIRNRIIAIGKRKGFIPKDWKDPQKN